MIPKTTAEKWIAAMESGKFKPNSTTRERMMMKDYNNRSPIGVLVSILKPDADGYVGDLLIEAGVPPRFWTQVEELSPQVPDPSRPGYTMASFAPAIEWVKLHSEGFESL